MPDRSFRIPSPYPIGRGAASPRLWTEGDDLFVTFPEMAMDELPKAALKGAAGGARDQEGDPDDDTGNGTNSPQQDAYKKLFTFLADYLDPDGLQTVGGMISELLGATDPSGSGTAMAGDSRRATPGYSRHFPNAHRLRTRTYG
jgi:hypothetical protein